MFLPKIATSSQVHCSNMFSRGVRMFRQVTCYFRSGSDWEADPVTFRPSIDRVSQIARFVTVPLGDRTASTIKCRFHFSDLWMLFSEVAFQSGKKRSGVGGSLGSFVWLHCISVSFVCPFFLSLTGSAVYNTSLSTRKRGHPTNTLPGKQLKCSHFHIIKRMRVRWSRKKKLETTCC